MRKIISASFPEKVATDIKKRAKKKNVSVSSYFLYLYEIEKDMIGEEEIIALRDQARKDYLRGKTRAIGSLSDLMT
ncbi:hypothetical protein K9L63_02515 [Candidatus Gracilibacteria bacterium]|nr:hypothetical protein [Candidatus Gracilibacteria bacterium]